MSIRNMRLLIEPSSAHCLNAGDIAMLQVAYRRFREFWPEAAIHIVTNAPDRLATYCPGALPLEISGRNVFFEGSSPASRLGRRLPEHLSIWVSELELCWRQLLPGLTEAVLKRRFPERQQAVHAYLDAVRTSSLVVATGAGQITDAFAEYAGGVLNTLELAIRYGIPAVLLGQGIGPLSSSRLLKRCRKVLPKAQFISLREGFSSLPILDSLGVARDRVTVTGDDAIESAFERRPAALGSALGVNARFAPYSGVGPDFVPVLREVVQQASLALPAPVTAVAISRHPRESDVESIGQLLEGIAEVMPPAADLDSLQSAISQAGRCRVVVTGSYHAALFALAQGVSVVGLANASYYTAKFEGLMDQFGTGCGYVAMDQPNFAKALRDAIHRAWEGAPEARPRLLEAATRQIETGRRAYERIRDEI
jgi:polysaccharide pyruvyl transferase WcaK-like protein